MPIVDWQGFSATFARARRRVDGLTPSQRRFARFVFALGARVSDAPSVVGVDAPTHSMLAYLDDGNLLTRYGLHRSQAVRTLALEAVHTADRDEVWRENSIEACAWPRRYSTDG